MKPQKILLVEDNKIVQTVCKMILNNFFQNVDVAGTGQEVLELQDKNNYDLIFMDISLPDGFGYDFAKKIKETKSNTIIIALTAHNDNETRAMCKAAGMEDYIVKPLDKNKTQDVIKKFFSKV